MTEVAMQRATIAGLGPIWMPKHRVERTQRPWWEAARLHSMHHFLDGGDAVLDIGTEEGDMSALIATWVGSMFLVEPNPQAWPWIAETFDSNDLMRSVAGWWVGLLGSPEQRDTRTTMTAGEISGVGYPHQWPPAAGNEWTTDHGFYHLAEHAEMSAVITVDELMTYSGGWHPTAITMDVEGGELHVLRGALETIAECRPKIWISVHGDFMRDLYGHEPVELYALMNELEYDRVFLASDHETHDMFLPREFGWRY